MEECSTCRFFKRGLGVNSGIGNRYGQCCRFPKYEEKHDSEGCGEHRPMTEIPIKEPAKGTGTRRA
jgi:hypothetical protein